MNQKSQADRAQLADIYAAAEETRFAGSPPYFAGRNQQEAIMASRDELALEVVRRLLEGLGESPSPKVALGILHELERKMGTNFTVASATKELQALYDVIPWLLTHLIEARENLDRRHLEERFGVSIPEWVKIHQLFSQPQEQWPNSLQTLFQQHGNPEEEDERWRIAIGWVRGSSSQIRRASILPQLGEERCN